MPTVRIHNDNQENALHFITITVIEWIDIMTSQKYFDVVIDSLKFCQKNKGMVLYDYVIMSNHLHLIVATKHGYKLSQIISDFKKHTTIEFYKLLKDDNRKYILNLLTNSYNRKKDYDFQVWQRENYPELIETEKFLLTKVNYIHNNPVKRGYVVKPEDWKYSSARNKYLLDDSVIKVDNY